MRLQAIDINSELPGSRHRTKFDYDAHGNRVSATDAAGQTTFLRYDAESRLVEAQDALGNLTRIEYDPEGAVVATTDPRGATTRFALDNRGRITTVTNPSGATTNIGYCAELGGGSCGAGDCGEDPSGGFCCIVDALGNTTTRAYDELGRVVSETDALGYTTQTGYDELGRRETATDAKGRVTRFEYDEIDRVVSVEDPIGGLTSYGYDGRGNRTSVTDANGNTTTFGFDLANRLVRETTPIGTVTEYAYDLVGNRTSKLDGKGQATSWAYDAARRLTGITYDDGTTASFEYDARGRRTRAENVDSHREMTYDALGRLETVLDQETGRTIHYSFDEAGNRTSMSVEPDDQETLYQWDLRGRLVRMTDPEGGQYRFAYDAAGRRTLTTYPNGIRRTDAYDDASRATAIVYTSPRGNVLRSFAYEMDENGNRLSKTFEDGTAERYGYDDLDRLVSAQYQSGRAVSYEYDGVGDRLRMVDEGVEMTYRYNRFGQLLNTTNPEGVTTYTWDENGNQTEKAAPDGTTEYTWDARDRLAAMALPGGRIASYGYNTENLRVSISDALGARSILLDGTQEWSEYDAEGSQTLRYLSDPERPDSPLAHSSSEGPVQTLTDFLGSPYSLTDADARIVARSSYDVWGRRQSDEREARFVIGFAGRPSVEAGQALYARARYLDVDSGQWLSPEPLRALRSLGAYGYAEGNPATLRDPSGETPFIWDRTCYWLPPFSAYRLSAEIEAMEAARYLEGRGLTIRFMDKQSGLVGTAFSIVFGENLIYQWGAIVQCACDDSLAPLHGAHHGGVITISADAFNDYEREYEAFAAILLHEWTHYSTWYQMVVGWPERPYYASHSGGDLDVVNYRFSTHAQAGLVNLNAHGVDEVIAQLAELYSFPESRGRGSFLDYMWLDVE